MLPMALTDSLKSNAYKSLMESIDGMSNYKFTINSSNGDNIVDKFETEDYDVVLKSGTTGKQIKFDVFSRVKTHSFFILNFQISLYLEDHSILSNPLSRTPLYFELSNIALSGASLYLVLNISFVINYLFFSEYSCLVIAWCKVQNFISY